MISFCSLQYFFSIFWRQFSLSTLSRPISYSFALRRMSLTVFLLTLKCLVASLIDLPASLTKLTICDRVHSLRIFLGPGFNSTPTRRGAGTKRTIRRSITRRSVYTCISKSQERSWHLSNNLASEWVTIIETLTSIYDLTPTRRELREIRTEMLHFLFFSRIFEVDL